MQSRFGAIHVVVLLLFTLVLLQVGRAGPISAVSTPLPPADRVVAAAPLSEQTDQYTAQQDCRVRYAMSPTDGSVIPAGSKRLSVTTQWEVGPCIWTVELSSPGASGIGVTFEPTSEQVGPDNPVWESAATIAVAPTASPGTYELDIHIDATVNGTERPRRTFTYVLYVAEVPSATPTATASPTVTPTVSPTPTATPTAWVYLPLVVRSEAPPPTPIPVLFADDFEDTDRDNDGSTDWFVGTQMNGEIGYQDGEYRTHVQAGVNRTVLGGPGDAFSDFDLEVSARAMEPASSGAYLLGFRYRMQDGEPNFYCAGISPSGGTYRICKVVDGVWPPANLAAGESAVINAGTDSNRLRIVAQGERIRLYANGEFLAEINDAAFSGGKLLLGAWNYSGEQPLTVYWDYVVVYPAGARPAGGGSQVIR